MVALGDGVAGPATGAVVAVYELLGCGRCSACAQGQDNVCRDVIPGAIGITRDGGMADHVVVPARNLVALGDVDPVHAAPLTDAGMTALHAVERGRPLLEPGATAVVVGIGGLGHLAVQFLRATSKVRVLAVDVDRARLDFAAGIGARRRRPHGAGRRGGHPRGERRPQGRCRLRLRRRAREPGPRRAGHRARGAIVVTGGGGGRLSITAQMGAGGAPDREIAIVHTFGGTRNDLMQALALAEAGRVQTHVEAYDLEAAGRVLADLDAGTVLGRAVLVP